MTATITTALNSPFIYIGGINGALTSITISTIEFNIPNTGVLNAVTSSTTTSTPTTTPSATTETSSATESSSSTASTPACLHTSTCKNCPSVSAPIAGAAVGSLVGGALIAALLTFFIMSSRKRSGRHRRSARLEKVSPTRDPNESQLGTSVAAWEKHLPQPEADSDLRSAVSALFDQIEMHVEQYYQDVAVKVDASANSDIAQFDSHLYQGSILDSLASTRRPTTLIKHTITHFIVSSTSVDSDLIVSFLPPAFTALPQSMKSATRAGTHSAVFDAAYCKWRVLTAYLSPEPENDSAYLVARDKAITTAADKVYRAFAPWARDREGTRRSNLISIMKVAAELGVTIFSQPSTLVWDWRLSRHGEESRGGLRLVLRPGLIRTAAAQAGPLETSQVIAPPLACILEMK